MNAHITITAAGRDPLIITMPDSVVIESSWRMLTDKATITLARKSLLKENERVRDIFPVGAGVVIKLGFNMQFTTEFVGYVTNVSDELPLTITCEDEMWKLKTVPVHLATRKQTYLPDFIASITSVPIKAVAPYTIGAVRFNDTTVAKVLEYFQEKLKLYSYFDNGQLVVGEVYADDAGVPPITINLDLATNSSLKFEDREKTPVKLTAVSTLSNGSKIQVTVGDENGIEQRTAHYNITSKSELEKLAQEDLRKYSRSRYVGSFETYQDVVVRHGYKVKLTSDLYPERAGLYYCDKTTVRFDSTPQNRREIGLDELVQ
jgi:hypothetical protein